MGDLVIILNTLECLKLPIFICNLILIYVVVTINLHYGSLTIPVFAQTHNMTSPSPGPNSDASHKRSTFSAIGQISSLVITVPDEGFNISDAFKVILTGEWNLSVNKGKITNFAANFLASPMDGTKGHIHQITDFKSTTGKSIELTSEKNISMNGTADIRINGIVIWKNAHLSVLIFNGSTVSIDPDDKDTENHFGKQSVYGIVTRLIS